MNTLNNHLNISSTLHTVCSVYRLILCQLCSCTCQVMSSAFKLLALRIIYLSLNLQTEYELLVTVSSFAAVLRASPKEKAI